MSIPTAHSRFSNKEELNSTNTYLAATQVLKCVKDMYQKFWSVVEISKSSWGFYLYYHLPTGNKGPVIEGLGASGLWVPEQSINQSINQSLTHRHGILKFIWYEIKTWQNSSLTNNISRNISVPIKLIVDEKQAHYPSIWQCLHTAIYLVSPYYNIHSVSIN